MTPDPRSPKNQLLPALGAYVLENGLAGASLRPLARAAGTSDRMLIYHFGTKDRLVEAVLAHLASDLEAVLTEGMPVERSRSLDACVAEILGLLRADHVRRYLLVWLEIVAAAGLGNDRFKIIGSQMLRKFLPWLEARLPDDVIRREAAAATLLALIEGCIVMDAVGMAETADLATRTLAAFVPNA